jgi:hypothetical protein
VDYKNAMQHQQLHAAVTIDTRVTSRTNYTHQ